MRVPIHGTWAKARPRGSVAEWHPLAAHSHDVAAVLAALLALPIPARRLAALAALSDLDAATCARLVVLAFLHDFGKANHGFQAKILPSQPSLWRAGHIAEAGAVLHDEALWEAAGLSRIDPWFGCSYLQAQGALAAVLGHHGAPPAEIADRGAALKHAPLWAAGERRRPVEDVATLLDEAERCWPVAFRDGPPLPEAPRFWHGFLGLLQFADWLGSDESADAFPYAEAGDPPREIFARIRAVELLAGMGVNVSSFRDPAVACPDFSAVADFEPTQIQQLVGDAKERLVVMESETGSGKTEGALYRFARLFAAGRVDGLFFALPTRVAATQMVERVLKARDRLFPDPARRPAVVRALPGEAGADGKGVRPLPDFAAEWSDDPDAAERRRRWAAERPKRFLAAPIAVGTIDQALLGAARVPHAQMRASLLSRSLLVVDEVHASDLYMSALLANLLSQHLAAGGEALLLSATLGSVARSALMQAGTPRRRRKPAPGLAEAVTLPYPAVSTLGEDGQVETRPAVGSTRTKRVRVRPEPIGNDPPAVSALALDAARNGARVLVIRNTVRDAVETRRALEAMAPGDPVQFCLAGRPTLHHGRFARGDRCLLDAAAEVALGKAADRSGGLVLVGTQTLEISLDIDADFLVTDLAPADVLLQRIGRLHRHERCRPAGFEVPSVHVLAPDDFRIALAALKRGVGGPRGFGSVYPDLLVLEATRRLVVSDGEWPIPAMNRRLVEEATHPDRIEALVEDLAGAEPLWREAWLTREGRTFAAGGQAKEAAIAWDEPVTTFTLKEDAATRLGTRDAELVFDPAPAGPFGVSVDRLVIPSQMNPAGAFEAVNIEQKNGSFAFQLGEKRFVYDSYGLRVAGDDA